MLEFIKKHITPLGAFLGLLAGASDYALLLGFGVEMRVGEHDVTLAVCTAFAVSSSILGMLIGKLYTAGARLKVQRATIERQLAELEETQARAIRNETLAAVGVMAARVAHEVRNPLAVIRSSAEMLAEQSADKESPASQFIVDEVDRLDRFVSELLDLSRPFEPDIAAGRSRRVGNRSHDALSPDEEVRDRGVTSGGAPELWYGSRMGMTQAARGIWFRWSIGVTLLSVAFYGCSDGTSSPEPDSGEPTDAAHDDAEVAGDPVDCDSVLGLDADRDVVGVDEAVTIVVTVSDPGGVGESAGVVLVVRSGGLVFGNAESQSLVTVARGETVSVTLVAEHAGPAEICGQICGDEVCIDVLVE